ncbi:MAG: hypothetical protein ABI792_09190 [bacterium]
MKTIKFILAVVIACLLLSSVSEAQMKMKRKKVAYPQFSLSPVAGIAFPIGDFGGFYKAGPSFGLDISYRVNREVGFYAKVGYSIFSNKEGSVPLVTLSDTKILEATVGPRYFFTSKNLKSALFLEAGGGIYSIKQQLTTAPAVLEQSVTKFGVNAGIGGILNLSRPIDLIFKVKFHNILTEGGSTSFIVPQLGLDFRFN